MHGTTKKYKYLIYIYIIQYVNNKNKVLISKRDARAWGHASCVYTYICMCERDSSVVIEDNISRGLSLTMLSNICLIIILDLLNRNGS